MASKLNSDQFALSAAWQKMDAFLSQQMQQVEHLLQESDGRVAKVSLAQEHRSQSDQQSDSSRVEEANKRYLDNTVQQLQNNVNQALENAMICINEQAEAINQRNKL